MQMTLNQSLFQISPISSRTTHYFTTFYHNFDVTVNDCLSLTHIPIIFFYYSHSVTYLNCVKKSYEINCDAKLSRVANQS